jgi:hypothetical protein
LDKNFSLLLILIHLSHFLLIICLARLLDETMFDERYLNLFYNKEYFQNPENIDNDFKEAYFMYIDTFCKATSPFWKNYVNAELIVRAEGHFSPNLTTSDEALTLWLLQLEIQKAKDDADLILKIGTDEWNKKRDKRKRGQHKCVSKQSNYITLYNKIRTSRADQESNDFWQNLYFDELFAYKNNEEREEMSRKLEMRKRQSGVESHILPFDNDF